MVQAVTLEFHYTRRGKERLGEAVRGEAKARQGEVRQGEAKARRGVAS